MESNINHHRLSKEQLEKLRKTDFSQIPGLTAAEDDMSAKYGAPGTQSREEFDAKAKAWYYGDFSSLKLRRIR